MTIHLQKRFAIILVEYNGHYYCTQLRMCVCAHACVHEKETHSVLVAALPQIHQMLSDDESMHEKRFGTLYDKRIPTLPLKIL